MSTDEGPYANLQQVSTGWDSIVGFLATAACNQALRDEVQVFGKLILRATRLPNDILAAYKESTQMKP